MAGRIRDPDLRTGEADIAAVTALDVVDHRRYVLGQRRKPATVNKTLDVLPSFFTSAKEAGTVHVGPTEGVRRAREERGAPRWLTRREVGSLVRAVQKYGSKRDQALVTLLLHSGLRVAEPSCCARRTGRSGSAAAMLLFAAARVTSTGRYR